MVKIKTNSLKSRKINGLKGEIRIRKARYEKHD